MGYPNSIIKHLHKYSHFIKDKDVLTLGVLYQSKEISRDLRNMGLGNVMASPKKSFSKNYLGQTLHAKSVSSMDVDNYQGAEIIANLNKEINKELVEKFDTIIDSGTLEHLSNFPTALKNIMKMLRVNGTYHSLLPVNNWVDHGFFQFSPTFFIDLCKHNSHIQPEKFFYGTHKYFVNYSELDKYGKRAFERASRQIFIGGVLRKINNDEITFDLTQSKYVEAYRKDSYKQTDIKTMISKDSRDISSIIRGGFSKIPLLSLEMKLFILNAKRH